MNLTNTDIAGLTSEVAVNAIGNRYDLIIAGARRMRELGRGDAPRLTLNKKHSHCVTTMLEIEAGKVTRDFLYKELDIAPRQRHKKDF